MNQLKASKENNFLYNPLLKNRAKELRNNGTKAEACLWKYALRNNILGYKFLRQRPVLNYIAYFMCPELFLIIEADGITHFNDIAKNKDHKRQTTLENAGFTVLRFEDNVILEKIDLVLAIINNTISELDKIHSSPLTSSPLKGHNITTFLDSSAPLDFFDF